LKKTVLNSNGDKFYYFNGKFHREDGPAIERRDGTKAWLLNDNYHRINGPAIEYANGEKSWWYYGEWIECSSQKEFEKLLKLKFLW